MKPVAFDYVAARSLEEALSALAEGGDDAKPIAGGQSLVPALNLRLVRPTLLVDLNRAGLNGIETGETTRIGATARQALVQDDDGAHPLLREALAHVGHVGTRNRGTVGGSVAHADGAAEIPVCLAAVGGTIDIAGPDGPRSTTTDEFFLTHFATALRPGELVVATRWPGPTPAEGSAFEELALRTGDFAQSMAAVVLRRIDGVARDVRIVVGAVSDRPLRLVEAAAALEGSGVGPAQLATAADAARETVAPHDTVHADAEYLRHVTGVLVARAAARAWERAA